MKPEISNILREELLEELSALEHERWSHWQKYLHSKCKLNRDGSLTIPADLVAHWEKQMATPYAALSREEQNSDREQVTGVFMIIEKFITRILSA